MKSVKNILGYFRGQFYRFLRGCNPWENLWNCSWKYPKMFKNYVIFRQQKIEFKPMSDMIMLLCNRMFCCIFGWFFILMWIWGQIMKKLFCCQALELFCCLQPILKLIRTYSNIGLLYDTWPWMSKWYLHVIYFKLFARFWQLFSNSANCQHFQSLSWLLTISKLADCLHFKVSWLFTFKVSWLSAISNSDDCLHFQSRLIVYIQSQLIVCNF